MLKKFVSLTTALAFLSSFIVAPSVQGAVEYAEGTRYAAQARAALDRSLPAFGIDISPANGRVTDVRDFGAGPLVINIQDLHCHPEVQRNIAALLSQIERSHGAGRSVQVFVEGGYGTVDTSWISALKDPALRASLMAALVESGHLTGAELYAMQVNRPTMLTGLEDEALHKGNIVRLGKILENKPRYEQSLATLRRELAVMQARHFTSQNRRLSRIIARYRAGGLSSAAYYALLGKYIEKIGASPRQYSNTFSISTDQYPNIALLRSMASLSKGMNFRLVSAQMQKFMQSLRGVMSFADYNALVDQTQQFKDMDRLYLMLAAALAGPESAAPWVAGARRELARYRELQAFFSYVLMKQRLNPVQLVREERLLIEQLRSAFSRTTPELEVAFLTDFFDCYSGYLLNRLSADDYGYFASRFDKFQSVWGKYTFENRIKGLADDYPLLNEYYAVNARRNAVFLRTIDAFLAPGGNRVAVIVSGGFHTEGMAALLASRKISSATITPGVTQDTHGAEAAYVRRALEQSRLFGSQALQLVLGSFGAKVQNVTDTTIELAIENHTITISHDGNTIQPLAREAAQILQNAGAPSSAEALNAALQGIITQLSALSTPTLLSVADMIMALGQAVIESGSRLGWWGEEGLIWKIANDPAVQKMLADNKYDVNEIALFPQFLQNAISDHVRDYEILKGRAEGNVFITALLAFPSINELLLPLLAEKQEAVSYADRLATLRGLPMFTRLGSIIGFSYVKGLEKVGYEVLSVLRHVEYTARITREVVGLMNVNGNKYDIDKAEFIILTHDNDSTPYRHVGLLGPRLGGIMEGIKSTKPNFFKEQIVAALRENGISIPVDLEHDLLNFDTKNPMSDEAKIATAVKSAEGAVEDILFMLKFGLLTKATIPEEVKKHINIDDIPDNLDTLSIKEFDDLMVKLTIQALEPGFKMSPDDFMKFAGTIKDTARAQTISNIHKQINTPAIPGVNREIQAAYETFKQNYPTATDEDFVRYLLTIDELTLREAGTTKKPSAPQEAARPSGVTPSTQELGERWGWPQWAIKDILAPVKENLGILLQPWKFGKLHTQYIEPQQETLTKLAWGTAITAALAGTLMGITAALATSMPLAGVAAGILVWLATGFGIHALWNIFSSLPATMGTSEHDATIAAAYGERGLAGLLKMGEDLIQEHQLDFAGRVFQAILQRDTNHTGAMVGLAHIAFLEKHFNSALKLYHDVLNIDKENTLAHNGIAAIKVILNRKKEAIEGYNHVLSLDMGNKEALDGLGSLYAPESGEYANEDFGNIIADLVCAYPAYDIYKLFRSSRPEYLRIGEHGDYIRLFAVKGVMDMAQVLYEVLSDDVSPSERSKFFDEYIRQEDNSIHNFLDAVLLSLPPTQASNRIRADIHRIRKSNPTADQYVKHLSVYLQGLYDIVDMNTPPLDQLLAETGVNWVPGLEQQHVSVHKRYRENAEAIRAALQPLGFTADQAARQEGDDLIFYEDAQTGLTVWGYQLHGFPEGNYLYDNSNYDLNIEMKRSWKSQQGMIDQIFIGYRVNGVKFPIGMVQAASAGEAVFLFLSPENASALLPLSHADNKVRGVSALIRDQLSLPTADPGRSGTARLQIEQEVEWLRETERSIVNVRGATGYIVGETADHYIIQSAKHININPGQFLHSKSVKVSFRADESAKVYNAEVVNQGEYFEGGEHAGFGDDIMLLRMPKTALPGNLRERIFVPKLSELESSANSEWREAQPVAIMGYVTHSRRFEISFGYTSRLTGQYRTDALMTGNVPVVGRSVSGYSGGPLVGLGSLQGAIVGTRNRTGWGPVLRLGFFTPVSKILKKLTGLAVINKLSQASPGKFSALSIAIASPMSRLKSEVVSAQAAARADTELVPHTVVPLESIGAMPVAFDKSRLGDGLIDVIYNPKNNPALPGLLKNPGKIFITYSYDGSQEFNSAEMVMTREGLWQITLDDVEDHRRMNFFFSDEKGKQKDDLQGMMYQTYLYNFPVSESHAHIKIGLRQDDTAVVPALLAGGMDRTILMCRDNEQTLALIAKYPQFRGLAWATLSEKPYQKSPNKAMPHASETSEIIALLKKNPGLVGIKLHPTIDEVQLNKSEKVREILNELSKLHSPAGLPYVVLIHSASQYSEPLMFRELAEQFPGLNFVMGHMYIDNDSTRRDEAIEVARTVPNVFLETSWAPKEVIEKAVRKAGAKKVLFGSDTMSADHYTRPWDNNNYRAVIDHLEAKLSPEEFALVMSGNVEALYGFTSARSYTSPIGLPEYLVAAGIAPDVPWAAMRKLSAVSAQIVEMFIGDNRSDIVPESVVSAGVEKLRHAFELQGISSDNIRIEVSKSPHMFVRDEQGWIFGLPVYLTKVGAAYTLYIHQGFLEALINEAAINEKEYISAHGPGGLVAQFVKEEVFEMDALGSDPTIQDYITFHRNNPAHSKILVDLAASALTNEGTPHRSLLPPSASGHMAGVTPSTQELGERWGWPQWAIKDILAPVKENLGILLQPWKFGKLHTQYIEPQQETLTKLAWGTAITAALAGTLMGITAALATSMPLAGVAAGILVWLATGFGIHALWNIFSSLPATMGGGGALPLDQLVQSLEARARDITGRGHIPIVCLDIDGTATDFAAPLTDDAVTDMLAFLEAGFHVVFNSRTQKQWYSERILVPLTRRLLKEDKYNLLNQVHAVLRKDNGDIGGEVYVGNKLVYVSGNEPQNWKAKGLQLFLQHFTSMNDGQEGEILAYLGDWFVSAGDNNDGAILAVDETSIHIPLIAVDVGTQANNIQTQPGQTYIRAQKKGPEGTRTILRELTGKFQSKYSQSDTTVREVSADESVVILPFSVNSRTLEVQEKQTVVIVVESPGFVWAGRAEQNGWAATYMVPLVPMSNGTYQALLPADANEFTFFWADGQAGLWEAGKNFSLKRHKIQTYAEKISMVRSLPAFTRLAKVSGFTSTLDLTADGYSFVSLRAHDDRVSRIAGIMARKLGLNADRAEFLGLVHDIGVPPFTHLALQRDTLMSQIVKILNKTGGSYFKTLSVAILRRAGIYLDDQLANDIRYFDIGMHRNDLLTKQNISDEMKVALASESVVGVVEDILLTLRYDKLDGTEIGRDSAARANKALQALKPLLFAIAKDDIPEPLKKYFDEDGVPVNLYGISRESFEEMVLFISLQALRIADQEANPQEVRVDNLLSIAKTIKDQARKDLLDPFVFKKTNDTSFIAMIDQIIQATYANFKGSDSGSSDESFVEFLTSLTEPELLQSRQLLAQTVTKSSEDSPVGSKPSWEELVDTLRKILNAPEGSPAPFIGYLENLGGTKIISVQSEGTRFDYVKKRLIFDPTQAFFAIINAIPVLSREVGVHTIYVFGANETSDLSKLVHGAPFDEIASGKVDNVANYLNEIREQYSIEEGWEILDAFITPRGKVYIKVRTPEGAEISTIIGYDTKKTVFTYLGQEFVQRERSGNPFSRKGMRGNKRILTDDQLRKIFRELHEGGQRGIMDMYGWRSPDCVTKHNYQYFAHDIISEYDTRTDTQLYEQIPHPGCILYLDDGRRVLVHSREDANDQLFPDLGLKRPDNDPINAKIIKGERLTVAEEKQEAEYKKFEFWKDLFLDELKEQIDLGADGVRWDLAADLKTIKEEKRKKGLNVSNSEEHDLLWAVMQDAIDYSIKKYGRNYYFVPEVYGANNRAMFDNFNLGLISQLKLSYIPIGSFYDDPGKALYAKDAGAFEECIKKMILEGGRYRYVINLANYDDYALIDIVPNPTLRLAYQELLAWLGKAGFNTLSATWDDTGKYPIVPVVGGEREGGVYKTHKYTDQRDIAVQLEVPLPGLLTVTHIIQSMAGSPDVDEVRYTNGVVTFVLVGGGTEVFNLRNMGKYLNADRNTAVNRSELRESTRPNKAFGSTNDAAILPENEARLNAMARAGASPLAMAAFVSAKEFWPSMKAALRGSDDFVNGHAKKAGARRLVKATERGLAGGLLIGTLISAVLLSGTAVFTVGGLLAAFLPAVLGMAIGGAGANLIAHMLIDHVVVKDLAAAVKQYGSAYLENGDIHLTLLQVSTPPADMEQLKPLRLASTEDGPVWGMVRDGRVIVYSKASPAAVTRAVARRLGADGDVRGEMQLSSRLKELFLTALRQRSDGAAVDTSAVEAALSRAVAGSAARIEEGAPGVRMRYDENGTVVLSRDMMPKLTAARAIAAGDAVATANSVLLYLPVQGNGLITSEMLAGLEGTQVVVDGIERAKQIQSLALSRKRHIRVFALVSKDDMQAAYDAGLAGCVIKGTGDIFEIMDFASATPGTFNRNSVPANMIKPASGDVAQVRESLNNSRTPCVILDVGALAAAAFESRDLSDRQQIIGLLGEGVLSLFGVHLYTPRFVRDAAYGIPADQLTAATRAAYLSKLKADVSPDRYAALAKAFTEAWAEREKVDALIAQLAEKRTYRLDIPLHHRQMLGRALTLAGPDFAMVTHSIDESAALTEAAILQQSHAVEQAVKDGTLPQAITNLIIMIDLFDAQFPTLDSQLLQTNDVRALTAILSAA